MSIVTTAITRGVLRITFDDQPRRNALSVDLMRQCSEALDRAAQDDEVRVVLLTAVGSAFCSGADLSASGFSADGPARYSALIARLLDHPKPTIARVQGHVAGGGNGLVAACDLAVAHESATFAFTEVRVGVAPAIVSVPVLARIGSRDAAEFMLLGERVSATRVGAAGLLTTVALDDFELDSIVDAWVTSLLKGGPEALARTKTLLHRVPDMERHDALVWTEQLSSEAFKSDEAAEGKAAFKQRRTPAWWPATE